MIVQLETLIVIDGDKDRTRLTWLREWSEATTQKNLAGIVERLQTVRALNVGTDREQRIHRARYAAIARETTILSTQHLSRFDKERRVATLMVFAREMEAILTDAGIAMFDKMLGIVFRRSSAQGTHGQPGQGARRFEPCSARDGESYVGRQSLRRPSEAWLPSTGSPIPPCGAARMPD